MRGIWEGYSPKTWAGRKNGVLSLGGSDRLAGKIENSVDAYIRSKY